ncbi:MAG TPA: small-conductance mechanosensitive ion channel [Candidatus Binatia bacterium]|nr:small-conductance mechanosensitive ion channel [Candidatus Binatia bacterium]
MENTVQNWGDAVMVSATEALQNFLGFLPALVGAILILIIGWFLAGLLAGLVERGLKMVGFERAAQTTGISSFIERSGSSWTASAIVAEIIKWFIRLIAIQAAASILGLNQISSIINAILLWLPNLVVAIAIIVIGALIARFVGGLVRGSTSQMGFSNSELLGSVSYYAILAFAIIAAVNQLGIAATVVNTLFIGLVALVVLAVGLAFGLGGQQTAAQITAGWYEKGRAASQKVARYQSQSSTGSSGTGTAATAPATGSPPGGGSATNPEPSTPPREPTP